MRFIHFSDLHIDSRSDEIYGVDTMDNLRRAVDRMNQEENVDFAVLSGDISNDGSVSSYLMADRILSALYFPVYASLGNHDSSIAFKECYGRLANISAPRIHDTPCGLRFIFLDSVWPDELSGNKSRGLLSEEELSFLDGTLSDGTRSVIVMHHPCIPPGGWMDRRILTNRSIFMDCLSERGNVLAVLSGHNHSPFTSKEDGILFSVSPATGTTYGIGLEPYEEAHSPGFDVYDYLHGNLLKKTVLF